MKKIRKKIVLSFIICIVIGIPILINKKENVQLIGQYESVDYGAIQRILHNISTKTSWAMGTSLTISEDSTFILLNCSSIQKGSWKKEKDSLILFVNDVRYRNDSLQEHGYQGEWLILPNKPLKYKIEDGRLLRNRYSEKSGIKKRTRMDLEKTDSNTTYNASLPIK